jgi:hypothetical protein
VDKAIRLMEQGAEQGVHLIAFPENPDSGSRSEAQLALALELSENARWQGHPKRRAEASTRD